MATKYEVVGSGIEDMTTAMNYETETSKDVLGQSRTKATTGNQTISVTPLTINADSAFARFVDTAVERHYELSKLEKNFLFVKTYKTVSGNPVAWTQKAVVVPDNWAAGNMDLQAEVTVNLVGEATFGTIDMATMTFTPEATEPVESSITYSDGDAARSDFMMFYSYEAS